MGLKLGDKVLTPISERHGEIIAIKKVKNSTEVFPDKTKTYYIVNLGFPHRDEPTFTYVQSEWLDSHLSKVI